MYCPHTLPGIVYQVLEILGCESAHGAKQKEKNDPRKQKNFRDLKRRPEMHRESYPVDHSVSYIFILRLICISTYE